MGRTPGRVGVVPGQARRSLARLFDALAQALPIIFVDAEGADPNTLDGMLVLDRAEAPDPAHPADQTSAIGPASALDPPRASDSASALARAGGRRGMAGPLTLLTAISQGRPSERTPIAFTGDQLVHRALRGRRLIESATAPSSVLQCEGDERVLAAAGGRAVWWHRDAEGMQASAFALHELQPGETLRDQLRPGRFMGLVPLLHFLHAVSDRRDARDRTLVGWAEQPLQAAFVIDDPNLHWTSYGFLKYDEAVGHARAHGYHLALATVPLDGWCVNRRAANLIGRHRSQVSLLVHGNDHVARELGRLSSDQAAERALAQALRRVAAFERRAGVNVSRVMAPPHGACSEAVLRAMFRLGFEAACISNPYPWRGAQPPPTPLAGWFPAEMVAGGMPVLPRYHLDRPREELVFRALLGQPLILYGHHWDMADGLDVLAQAAEDVNGLGEVRWAPLDQIVRANRTCVREGKIMAVRMFSSRALVEIPAEVDALRVETPDVYGGPSWRDVTCRPTLPAPTLRASALPASALPVPALPAPAPPAPTPSASALPAPTLPASTLRAPMLRAAGGWSSPALGVGAGHTLEISLEPEQPLNPAALASPALKPWPLARRVLVEGRDRLRPLAHPR